MSQWKKRATQAGAAAIMAAGFGLALPAQADPCTPDFADGFQFPGVQGYIKASVMYDAQDGNGPRLIVAGSFARAGGKACNGIAMFDGTNFVPLGQGVLSNALPTSASGIVHTLAVHDPDGAGPLPPELWVGGSFSRVRQASGTPVTVNGLARWNGSTQTWASVSMSPAGTWQTYALLSDNQTTGPEENLGPRIYAGNTAASGSSRYITAFRWNGSSYSQIFIGPDTTPPSAPAALNVVFTLAKYDGRVYLGGGSEDGINVMNSDGTGYQLLPAAPSSNANYSVRRMAVFQNRLWIGVGNGAPESFDGTSWQTETLGGLTETIGFTFGAGNPDGWMATLDLGTGPKLYLGGPGVGTNLADNSILTPYSGAAVWDGTSLSSLGHGFVTSYGPPAISTFTATTLRGQSVAFVGNGFSYNISGVNSDDTRSPASNAQFWNGSAWVAQYPAPVLGGGGGSALTSGTSGAVTKIKLDGVNERLVVEGSILSDATHPGGIAAYDGAHWASAAILSAPVTGPQYIRYDDGSGEKLFVVGGNPSGSSGDPMRMVKWTGTEWSLVGNDLSVPGYAAPGLFSGFATSAVVFDTDGAGSERPWLIFGGNTVASDAIPEQPQSVLAWDGSAWRTLGGGLAETSSGTDDPRVNALAVLNDGTGPKLYAGGSFVIDGVTWAVARYDGIGSTGTWTGIGRGTTFNSASIRVVDLGSGPRLLAFGPFTDLDDGVNTNPTPFPGVAMWTGTTWTGFSSDPVVKVASSAFAASVTDVAAFDDGSGGGVALYAIGSFESIGGVPAAALAKFGGGAWSAVGLGLNSFNDNLRVQPAALTVFDDDGAGPASPALYISGSFDNANGKYTQNFARYGCPIPATPTTDNCCRGTTCNPVAAGSCNGTVAGSASIVVDSCGLGNALATCCFADFNHDGTSTIDDLFLYLNAYFTGSPYANVGGDAVAPPVIDDLFLYINAYFTGCS